jgi:uroporphyrinogen decarboxylase
MTSRERIRKTLNHEEPDRVPIDFGQDFHNGINEVAYANLLKHLNVADTDEIKVYDLIQRLAIVDSKVLDRFRVDTRYILANPNENFRVTIETDGSFEDEWGVYRNRVGYCCETVRPPLAGMSKGEIINHRFPDPAEQSRFTGLRDKAKIMYETTDYALMAGQAATIFYFSSELLGYKDFMLDLVRDRAKIEVLVEKVLEWMMEFTCCYLDEVGEYVEVWWMGDDWGMQTGPVVAPATFRKIFKPRYRRLVEMVKTKTDAKVCLHTCGATYWVLEDLADVGIEAVHPLQPTASGNEDPEKLKKDFGDKFTFYSNIANTTVLSRGTPAEVEDEVRKKIKALAPGGGYILSGGHNIQADVPPENVVALFDTAYEAGQYPIS